MRMQSVVTLPVHVCLSLLFAFFLVFAAGCSEKAQQPDLSQLGPSDHTEEQLPEQEQEHPESEDPQTEDPGAEDPDPVDEEDPEDVEDPDPEDPQEESDTGSPLRETHQSSLP